MNTPVTFSDGKELILHSDREFTDRELLAFKSMTSSEFKQMILRSGRFVKIPMEDNPFLKNT